MHSLALDKAHCFCLRISNSLLKKVDVAHTELRPLQHSEPLVLMHQTCKVGMLKVRVLMIHKTQCVELHICIGNSNKQVVSSLEVFKRLHDLMSLFEYA